VCNGNEWNIVDRDETIDTLYDRFKYFLELIPEKREHVYNKLKDNKKRSPFDTEYDSKSTKDTKRELMFLLVNGRNMANKTKKILITHKKLNN